MAEKILLHHPFGMMIGGAFQREGKRQWRAFVFNARFVGDKKNRGVQQRVVDFIESDGLLEKLVAAKVFVRRGLIIAEMPIGSRKGG